LPLKLPKALCSSISMKNNSLNTRKTHIHSKEVLDEKENG
jgi:hypothetical protein